MKINISAVKALRSDNLRTTVDMQADELLFESIKKQGLLQPPGVCEIGPGKYRVVFGFRRFQALQKLVKDGVKGFPEEQEFTVVPSSDSETACLAENAARKDLNPAELSKALLKIHKGGLSGVKIAKMCGMSVSHVNNLLRVAEGLIPELSEVFAKGDLPERDAIKLAALEPTKQIAAYQASLAEPEPRTSAPATEPAALPSPASAYLKKRGIELANEIIRRCDDRLVQAACRVLKGEAVLDAEFPSPFAEDDKARELAETIARG